MRLGLFKMDKDKINLYVISNTKKNDIKLQALKIIKKSKRFEFFRLNTYNFSAINKYQGFVSFDKFPSEQNHEFMNKLSFEINYLCWFVTICVLEDYGDWSCEFDNDLNSLINVVNYIKKYRLSDIFCEIKYFLLAYKTLCQPNKKRKEKIDIEYWMCDIDTQHPKKEWYSYYLPVNLDDGSNNDPESDDILKARNKINA